MVQSKPTSNRAYKDLTLQQLRTFQAVCRLGGYAAAAREMLLTAPAVWEQIQGLERYFGTTLLVRQGNGMVITNAGRRLAELTQPLLAGLESIRDVMRQEIGVWPELLTIATNLRVYAAEISRGMKSFQREYSTVRLRLAFLRDAPLMDAVLSGEADVALTLEPGPQGLQSGLDYDVCGEADFLLVVPARHPLAKQERLSLSEITKYALIVGDEQTYSRQRLQEVFFRHRLLSSMKISVETNSDQYSAQCVRSGLGIAVTIGSNSNSLYQGLHIRSLRPWFGTVRVGFLRKKGASLSLAQRELERHINAGLFPKSG